MFIIKLANQRVESQPVPPDKYPRCSSGGFHKWGKAKVRKIVDISVSEITTQRYRCKNCHKTVTLKPAGVGRATRSHAFMAAVGVLYALGLSHRGIETAELTGAGFDYGSWFESMADELGGGLW